MRAPAAASRRPGNRQLRAVAHGKPDMPVHPKRMTVLLAALRCTFHVIDDDVPPPMQRLLPLC